MLAYWLLLGFFAAGAMLFRPYRGKLAGSKMLVVGSLLVALAIGLRYKVGADWETYKFLFSYADLLAWAGC